MLSTDISFSHFLLTFVHLSGSTSFHPQEFMTCHEMQQWLGTYGRFHENVNPNGKMIFSPYMQYTYVFGFLNNQAS